MSELTYTYCPTNILNRGKDRMRFELGDTIVENGADSAMLSDEEYDSIIGMYPNSWKKAKLALIEGIMRKLSYEVDEKVDQMSVSLHQRYEGWKGMYEHLKKELSAYSVPSMHSNALKSTHYFSAGMHDNPEAGNNNSGGSGYVSQNKE